MSVHVYVMLLLLSFVVNNSVSYFDNCPKSIDIQSTDMQSNYECELCYYCVVYTVCCEQGQCCGL